GARCARRAPQGIRRISRAPARATAAVSGADRNPGESTTATRTAGLDGAWTMNMNFQLSMGIAVLERTPHALYSMLAELPDEWIRATEGPETWSPFDIVGHLIHAERADWIPRARLILEQGANRRFTPFDRTAMFRDSQGRSLAQLLDEFSHLRTESLSTLAGWRLTDAQL